MKNIQLKSAGKEKSKPVHRALAAIYFQLK